jgi:glycosyltransferase involved in cell wall biosynthesis
VEPELTHTKLFLLAADLGAGQLPLLACGLPRERFALTVGALGRADGPAAEALRAAGVAVVPLPIRGPLDFAGMRKLRNAVSAANPAVLHCFGPAAVRMARLVLSTGGHGENVPHFVASDAAQPAGGFGGWLTTRQLRRADRVIATGRGEGERYRALGVRSERLSRIHPSVVPPAGAPDRADFCRDVGTPPDARLIFAGGALDAAHGAKEAVIAFDMLRYGSPLLRLVLTGDGPERAACADLGKALAFDDYRLHFTGPRPDLAAATQLAEIAWVTCPHGGELLALRAMAAGKPVVAYHTPELADVIDDGATGFLVPPGDRAALAAKSQELLADATLCAKFGDAGRARAAERFAVARMAEQHARVYQELAG